MNQKDVANYVNFCAIELPVEEGEFMLGSKEAGLSSLLTTQANHYGNLF